jgi:hypothetical protein
MEVSRITWNVPLKFNISKLPYKTLQVTEYVKRDFFIFRSILLKNSLGISIDEAQIALIIREICGISKPTNQSLS